MAIRTECARIRGLALVSDAVARETKKSIPPRTRGRTTRRGLVAQLADMPPPEPAMSTRPTKRDMSNIDPTTTVSRPTKRDTSSPEPATSSRPTKREISSVEPATSSKPTRRDLAAAVDAAQSSARGQFSIPSARGIPTDVVSGSIEVGERKRRRTGPIDAVHLVSASKREVTVIINEQVLTLQREDALALARIIATAFDS